MTELCKIAAEIDAEYESGVADNPLDRGPVSEGNGT